MSGPIIRAAASQAAPAQISQTAFLFAALGFAFLFYVTIKGDLPKWLGLLGLAGTASGAAPGLAVPAATAPATPTAPATQGLNTNTGNPLGITAPGSANPGVLNLGEGYGGKDSSSALALIGLV